MADIVKVPASVIASATGLTLLNPSRAGEAISAGDAFYISGGKAYLVDIDDPEKIDVAGVALNTASLDQYIVGASIIDDLDPGVTGTAGDPVYCSGLTNGALSSTYADYVTGDFPRQIGMWTATDSMKIDCVNPITIDTALA